MKKNIFKISIIAILFIILLKINTFASYSITVKTTTDRDTYATGGIVNVTVDWGEEMQAAGFILKFNSSKLSFVEASVNDNFYSVSEPEFYRITGYYYTDINVNWASLDNDKKTNMTFKFKAIEKGDASIEVYAGDPSTFANENLESPEQTNYVPSGFKTIKIATLGDVNLDGIINLKDVIKLNQYVANVTELNEEELINADVCADGVINQLDVDILNKHVAGWAVSLPFIYGDANCDGVVNNLDRVVLTRHIDYDTYKDFTLTNEGINRADVNLDGHVDDKDRIVLMRYLSKWAGYEKLPIQFARDNSLKFLSYDDNIFINGFDAKKMRVSELVSKFNNGLVVLVSNQDGQRITNTDDFVGTGMTIKIGVKNKEEITDEEAEELAGDIGEYTVLLYGDTTGDGKINAIDALALIKDINNKIPFTNEVYRQAGRIITSNNEEPTAVDALAIIKYVNGKYDINQRK